MSANLIQPTLQRADSSYIGTDGTNMYAFTASGATLWTVPNDTPQITTADGSVIGASGFTYDQNGVASGKLNSLPIYSWSGSAYSLGSVDTFVALALSLHEGTYCPFGGCNPSGNGTAAEQSKYPPLASCGNKMLKPPSSCPAPADLLWNAITDLTNQL